MKCKRCGVETVLAENGVARANDRMVVSVAEFDKGQLAGCYRVAFTEYLCRSCANRIIESVKSFVPEAAK